MENAFSQGKWLEVLRLAKELPKTDYWKQQSATLVQQATDKANAEAEQTLHTAYGKAISRDFDGALTALKQLPADVPAHAKVEEKIQEYTEKQQIQAVVNLQRAYDRAIAKDFGGALEYLQKIPKGTIVYAKAQAKIQEYTQKKKIQAENWLATAYTQALAQNFRGALASLEKVPSGTSLDAKVQEKTAEYTDKLNAWSNFWLQKAIQQASQKNYAGALSTLRKIPIGTDAYSQARDKISEYTEKQHQVGKNAGTAQPVAAALRQDLRAIPASPSIDRPSALVPDPFAPTLNSSDRMWNVNLH
jgi:3D (Asp-Asp-Asp) domain-containing protein